MTEIFAISLDGAYTIGDSISYSGQYFSISTTHNGVPGHVVLKSQSGYTPGINAQGTGLGESPLYQRGFIIPQDTAKGRPLRPQPLPGPVMPVQTVKGINDSGAFVGSFIRQNTPVGYVNNQGVITTIYCPDIVGTFADAINNADNILGESTDGSIPYIRFVLHQGTYTQLDNIPTSGNLPLAGINAGRPQ